MNRNLNRCEEKGSPGVFKSEKRPLHHVDEAKWHQADHERRNYIAQGNRGRILSCENSRNRIAEDNQHRC